MTPTDSIRYRGGWFTIPGSTGNYSVTDVGFQPQVVLFWGSNKSTEDTVVNGGVSGVMHGIMAWDDTTSTIKSWCSSLIPHDAARWEQKPIVQVKDGAANTDYQASAVSFDSGGFTVNFTVLPDSSRKIHWAAIGEMENSTAGIVTGRSDYSIGWRPYSGLHMGGLDDTLQDPLGSNAEQDDWGHMLTWGGKSFITTNDLNWQSMLLTCVDTPFNDQDFMELARLTGAASYIGFGAHFSGPFMVTGAHEQKLSGVGLTTVHRGVDSDNQGHFAELDAYSATGNVTPEAAVDAVETITSTVNEVESPALLILYGLSGRPTGQQAGEPNAVSMGFWTRDHQACFAANGLDDSFFQSSQYAFCSKVESTGAHAGEIQKSTTDLSLDLTTRVAGATPANMVWHMFGPLFGGGWVPQIYRRVVPA